METQEVLETRINSNNFSPQLERVVVGAYVFLNETVLVSSSQTKI